ncbi:MAG TPA: redoxin domain-containing protein [Pyrinomonadaceae bacterium]|nr:redoxin domain-containing protein [Pyrinomonadaceae bacterium]
MNRKLVVLVTFFAMLVFVAYPGMTQAGGGLEIGATVESFSLPDTEGKMQTLDGVKGKKGTVVVWLSAQCPVVKAYKDRINEIAAEAQANGINFVGINSNVTEDLNWVKSNATEFGYKFPILIDKGNVLADKWGATVTPEVYYFDGKNVLLYHGAIDNDRSGKNIQERYLKTAFDSALGGKKIEKTRANAFGCTIKRVGA